MTQKLFTAKWVLPITKPAIKDGAIVIEDDKIIAVDKSKKLMTDYPNAKLQDFGRSIILPGFIDLHTHLEYTCMRGTCDDLPFPEWKMQLVNKTGRLAPDDWLASSRLGAFETARSGITTIADITSVGASMKAALEIGLRGVIYFEIIGMDHSLVDSIIDEAKKEVHAWQKLVAGSNLTIGVAPQSPYSVCPPLFRETAEWARQEDLKVCVHLAGSKDEYDFVKYGSSLFAGGFRDVMGWKDLLWQPTGVSPVKYLLQWDFFNNDVLAVHCVHVSEEDIEILKQYDVAVAHCPRCSAKLAMGIAPLREFLDTGLRVGLGTDSPASNNTMDIFDEMRIGLLLQRGIHQTTKNMEAESFVRLATIDGAKALGMEKQIGSLEVGKQADIAIVDMSHCHQRPLIEPYSALVYTANQDNVLLTMAAGKTIFEGGAIGDPRAEEVLSQIEPVKKKLRINE